MITKQLRRKYYSNLEKYWKIIDGTKVDWAFDFISIHTGKNGYNLGGPFCLTRNGSKRPFWTEKKFDTFEEAKAFALKLRERLSKIKIQIHIVNCCD